MAENWQTLETLRGELGALTADITRLIDASDQHGSDDLKGRMNEVHTKLDNALSKGRDDGRDAIGELTANVSDVVEKTLRERPIAAVALLAGLGIIIGAALRR